MLDFDKYFSSNQEICLKNIDYKLIDDICESETVTLACVDELVLEATTEERVSFELTRHLKFEPNSLYSLSITYGFSLLFNQEFKKEIDWSNVDMTRELIDSKGLCLGNIISRISLLIAQITSTSGQMPIVTPPSLCCK